MKFHFGGHTWGSALAMILRETGRPMSTGELVELLRRDGFPCATNDLYSVARTVLVKRAARLGDVKKVGTALWASNETK
jgi:hypothetical protein